MARIAGVDLPPKKRAEIGLTYIYGIGRTRAKSLLYRVRRRSQQKDRRYDRRRGQQHSSNPRRRGFGGRRSPQGSFAQHQAAHRNAVLSRPAASPWSCQLADSEPTPTLEPAKVRARALWPIRRKRRLKPNGQSSGEDHQEEGLQKEGKARRPHVGVVHVQATFNNTIVTISDPDGNTVSWSSAGSLGIPRIPQRYAVRSAAGRVNRCQQSERSRICVRLKCG